MGPQMAVFVEQKERCNMSRVIIRSCKELQSLQSPFMYIVQTPDDERKDWVGPKPKDFAYQPRSKC